MILLLACAEPKAETPAIDACNGHAELCDRPFDTVTLAATHNSMSSEADGFSLANQPDGLTAQLDAGIRGMLLDTHYWDGHDGTWLCHGYCELGATPLVDGLTALRAFLDAHPTEVIALIVEDGITPADTDAAFQAAGLDALTYTWDGGAWPTLRTMIEANQRVLVTAETEGPPPAWYQHAWDLFVDTPYSFTSVDEFSCDTNRGNVDNPLFLLNHWVEDPLPSQALSAEANTEAVLGGRAADCTAAFGRNPNLVAVDWYTEGALFSVVDGLNGVGP